MGCSELEEFLHQAGLPAPSPPAVILGLRCGGDSNAARRLWSSHLAEWEVGKVNPEPLGQIWGLQDEHKLILGTDIYFSVIKGENTQHVTIYVLKDFMK